MGNKFFANLFGLLEYFSRGKLSKQPLTVAPNHMVGQ
jgi:hypothetical protein